MDLQVGAPSSLYQTYAPYQLQVPALAPSNQCQITYTYLIL